MPPYDTNMGYRPPQAPQAEAAPTRRIDLSPGQPMGFFRRPPNPQGQGMGFGRHGMGGFRGAGGPATGGPMAVGPAPGPAVGADAPMVPPPGMGGAYAQNQGLGATMTPEQIATMGDPEAMPPPAPPAQLTPEQVFANSQRSGGAPGGPQFDAAGNLISPIVRWSPPASAGLFSNRPGGAERSAFMGGY